MDYIYYGKDDNQRIIFIQQHDLSPYSEATQQFFKNTYLNMLKVAKEEGYVIVDISNWKHKDDEDLCKKIENYSVKHKIHTKKKNYE